MSVSGGSQPRARSYCYNAASQLDFVRSGPGCAASPAVISIGYDVQGNLQNKAGPTGGSSIFDAGNRRPSARASFTIPG